MAMIPKTALEKAMATRPLNPTFSGGLLAELGIAPGVELYTVADLLQQDFEGTLNALAQIGYTDVEAPNFRGRDAAEWRGGFQQAGLRCLCVHATIEGLKQDLQRQLDFTAEAGAEQILCIIPTLAALAYQLDDYRRAADDLAAMGEQAGGHPVSIGFHPNYVEMRPLGDTNPFEMMMQLMPPERVHLQLDVANAARAGVDPVACIRRHGDRLSTIHVKDLLPHRLSVNGVAASIELGLGALNWREIFEACRGLSVAACYFELEPNGDGTGEVHGWSTSDRNRIESSRMNIEYLSAL
jgi:sugar phosphate isomerase/epimerase